MHTPTTPQRIQRKRTKGWRMPPNTIYVGRGTVWGNPWVIKSFRDAVDGVKVWAVDLGDEYDATFGPEPGVVDHSPEYRARDYAVEKYETEWVPLHIEAIRAELRGKNLACWCPENQPCHADVLLEIANRVEP